MKALIQLLIIGGLVFFAYKYFVSKKENIILVPVQIQDVETKDIKAEFMVEEAKTIIQQTKGLMGRETLPLTRGMLFYFEQEAKHWMWMKNTKIFLDMLFINSSNQIIDIVENAQPESEKALGGKMCLYVLEINGGLSKKYGINIGDRIVTGNR